MMEQIFQNKCSTTGEFSTEEKLTPSLTCCFPLITAHGVILSQTPLSCPISLSFKS